MVCVASGTACGRRSTKTASLPRAAPTSQDSRRAATRSFERSLGFDCQVNCREASTGKHSHARGRSARYAPAMNLAKLLAPRDPQLQQLAKDLYAGVLIDHGTPPNKRRWCTKPKSARTRPEEPELTSEPRTKPAFRVGSFGSGCCMPV